MNDCHTDLSVLKLNKTSFQISLVNELDGCSLKLKIVYWVLVRFIGCPCCFQRLRRVAQVFHDLVEIHLLLVAEIKKGWKKMDRKRARKLELEPM